MASPLSLLDAFDGRDTAPLERFCASVEPTPALLRRLCDRARQDDEDGSVAATWVLKRLQEMGTRLSPAHQTRLLTTLQQSRPWATHLHVLQMLDHWPLPASRDAALLESMTNLSSHPKPMVRAWAYNGLAALAEQLPDERPRVRRALAAAESSDAASVRARIRRARAERAWLRGSSPLGE